MMKTFITRVKTGGRTSVMAVSTIITMFITLPGNKSQFDSVIVVSAGGADATGWILLVVNNERI